MMQDIIQRSHINKKWFYLFGKNPPVLRALRICGTVLKCGGMRHFAPAGLPLMLLGVLTLPCRRNLPFCLPVCAAADPAPAGLGVQVR